MKAPVIFALEAVLLLAPIRMMLLRAKWTRMAPRSAIALWQAIGISAGLAVLGGCLVVATFPSRGGPWPAVTTLGWELVAGNPTKSMTPNQLFGLTAGLIVATLLSTCLLTRLVGAQRARNRFRILLDLVGEARADAPGALVVDHPSATAYCLPGFRSRIVVSTGAIAALASDELSAVLAHERAHVHARHHLVLFPFRAISLALPGSRVTKTALSEVQVLVEMAAHDSAMRRCERRSLASALCRLTTTTNLPAGARGVGSTATSDRVERALAPRSNSRIAPLFATLGAAVVLATPVVTVLTTVGAK
jgi:Zn-dependent protease with chaperone function